MKASCPECDKEVSVTKSGKLWKHDAQDGSRECPGSREPYVEPPPLPGADEYVEGMAEARVPMVDVPETSEPEPKEPPLFSQPALPFSQPASQGRVVTQANPMGDLGMRIAAEMKQLFFQYNNRNTSDNRSAQKTLGPSEIGTPCSRRLALTLTRHPPVNPGGDGWAAFVGTCLHDGIAKMLEWASASTGRFAVETPLTFPSVFVPRGTGDLLDRVLCVFDDHKMMGQWSLDKLKTDGPSETYRVQVQTYAYGARLRGEVIQSVAIIGWPRDKSSLDDLYVWTDDYRPEVARAALARVDKIAEQSDGMTAAQVAASFPLDSSDCKFCPFHMPGAQSLQEGGIGCNGRR